jgi:hypothetical protein
MPKRKRAAPGTATVLPQDLRAGDRFIEDGTDWELTEHPQVMLGGKKHRATVRRVDEPTSVREMVWPSYRG